jgi:hypothetical protein
MVKKIKFFRLSFYFFPFLTTLPLFLVAISYLIGFKAIEVEAFFWALVAAPTSLFLLFFAYKRRQIIFRVVLFFILIFVMYLQTAPISVFFSLEPNTGYVKGYLNTGDCRLYTIPHIVIILLAFLGVFEIFLRKSKGNP